MEEYINREDALEQLKEVVYRELASDPDNIRANTIIDAIEGVNAADVEPVVRGEWKETGGYGMFHQPIIECSVCGDQIEETKRRKALKRCPNCGAHMERSGS